MAASDATKRVGATLAATAADHVKQVAKEYLGDEQKEAEGNNKKTAGNNKKSGVNNKALAKRLKSLSNDELRDRQQELSDDSSSAAQNELQVIKQEIAARKRTKQQQDAQRRDSRLQLYQDIVDRYNQISRYAQSNDITIRQAFENDRMYEQYQASQDELKALQDESKALSLVKRKTAQQTARVKELQAEIKNLQDDAKTMVQEMKAAGLYQANGINNQLKTVSHTIVHHYNALVEVAQDNDTTVQAAIKAVQHNAE